MAKYPREEVSYKKLYKELDMDKDLGIDWPELPEVVEDEKREIILIDITHTKLKNEIFTADEFDREFCEKNSIKMDDFMEIYNLLDRKHVDGVFKELDLIKAVSFNNPCDICGCYLSKDKVTPIVCQGCHVSVHEGCYGVVETPGDRWLCRGCIFHYEDKKCKFCKNTGGAMKKTVTDAWVHVICASLIPGVSFCNISAKEPVDETEATRLEGFCSICDKGSSYVTKCAFDSCNTAFDTGCAAQNVYCDIGNAIVYCNEHNPLRKTKRIQSKRRALKIKEMYPDLEHEIVLRTAIKFTKPVQGAYLTAIMKQPSVELSMRDSEMKSMQTPEAMKIIGKYWENKRSAIGYYFEDMFMFPNRFLKK